MCRSDVFFAQADAVTHSIRSAPDLFLPSALLLNAQFRVHIPETNRLSTLGKISAAVVAALTFATPALADFVQRGSGAAIGAGGVALLQLLGAMENDNDRY